MATQTRAIRGETLTPWWELLGWADGSNIPDLWFQDGVYFPFQPKDAGGNWNEGTIYGNPLTAFTSIGTDVVTSISCTLVQSYGDVGVTTADAYLVLGTGVYGAWSAGPNGSAAIAAIPFSTTPTDRTVTWNVSSLPSVQTFIKTNMTSTNFSVGVTMAEKTGGFIYIDTLNISIDHSPASSGPSIQKRFLKSFSSILTPV